MEHVSKPALKRTREAPERGRATPDGDRLTYINRLFINDISETGKVRLGLCHDTSVG